MKTRKYAFLGLALALALILSYVETLIPIGFSIPGIKLGLANLVVVVLLAVKMPREAALLSLSRILLSGFLFGSLSTIMYALAGGILSFIVMLLLAKTGKFSVRTVSMFGGIFHNMGQLAAAGFVVGFGSVIYYIPYLILAGLITGILIGITASAILPYLRRQIKVSGDLK